jgi:hypothetical protein
MSDSEVLDRDALYYPYIHIRDENWLKATLLCFPQVRRMVPPTFSPQDKEHIQAYVDTKGARGSLLAAEPTDSYPAFEAQRRLRDALERCDPERLKKYQLSSWMQECQRPPNPRHPNCFIMHEGKLLDLLAFLLPRQLAWPAKEEFYAHYNGYALHPDLGEAIMSLMAIGIAREKELDIVTSEPRIHRALTTFNDDAIISRLIGDSPERGVGASRAEIVDEVAQLVMVTGFDLTALTAAQIAELHKEGKSLRRFKETVGSVAKALPDIADPDERDRRFRDTANEVLEEWGKYQRSLPRFALDALLKAASWEPPAILTGLLAGAASTAVFASGAGLLVGVGVYAGYGAWEVYRSQRDGPYRYLSDVKRAVASVSGPPVISVAPRR